MKKILIASLTLSLPAFAANTLSQVVDACTQKALIASADKFDKDVGNYRHLYSMKVVKGSLAGSGNGLVTYEITYGNDEDGDTTYTAIVDSDKNCAVKSLK